MGGLLILLGLGALLLYAKGEEEKKEPTWPPGGEVPGVTPELESHLIQVVDGRKVYVPDARGLLVERLKSLNVESSTVTNDGHTIVALGDKGELVNVGESAYALAQTLHSAGFNIWITPTLFGIFQNRTMIATPADNPNPAPQYDVALLVSHADPWPVLQTQPSPQGAFPEPVA